MSGTSSSKTKSFQPNSSHRSGQQKTLSLFNFCSTQTFCCSAEGQGATGFQTLQIYMVTKVWHEKLLKISAFTPWGSAARLKDMKLLRIYSSFLWNAKNKAANAHKPQRQTLREGNAGTLKMEAQRDETCGISSAPAQAGRPHPVIMLYTTVSQSVIILLLKQLQINTEYLNVNSLSLFFFFLIVHFIILQEKMT